MVKGRQNCRAALLVMALEEQLVTSINKFLGQYKWLSDSYVIVSLQCNSLTLRYVLMGCTCSITLKRHVQIVVVR